MRAGRRRLALGALRRDEGAVAILVSLFSVAMFVLAALVVDMGMARIMRRDSQSAADAAALAGANALYASGGTPDFTGAVAAAKQFAAANLGTTDADWTACSALSPLSYTPTGVSTCISFDSATTPTNIRVVIPPRRTPSFFGAVVGYKGVDVNAYAQAAVIASTTPPCVFCVLTTMSHSIRNASIHVSNGDTWINGDLDQQPQGAVATVGGTTYIQGTANRTANLTAPYQLGVSPVTDPLSFLTLPPSDLGSLSAVPKVDPCTQGPGLYGGMTRNNGTCTLTPGLYVFTDPVSLAGTAVLNGSGVTLYFTCGTLGVVGSCAGDPVNTQGTFSSGGNASFTLTGPTSGPRKGLTMAFDRSDTATFSFTGSSAATTLDGTVYAPSAKMHLQGNGCGSNFRSQVVIADFDGVGNPACFTTAYDPSLNVPLPSTSNGLVQ